MLSDYLIIFLALIYLLGFSREIAIYSCNFDCAVEAYYDMCEEKNKKPKKVELLITIILACIMWPLGFYIENNPDKFM